MDILNALYPCILRIFEFVLTYTHMAYLMHPPLQILNQPC